MTRINKTAARKLFNEGKEFWITPCNMRPECGLLMLESWQSQFGSFDKLYNNFVYYNCDNERGRYPAFYVEG